MAAVLTENSLHLITRYAISVGQNLCYQKTIDKHFLKITLQICIQKRQVSVRATTSPSEEKHPMDVVFVQCKAAHTRSALDGAKNMFKEVLQVIFIDLVKLLCAKQSFRAPFSSLSKMVWATRNSSEKWWAQPMSLEVSPLR